MQKIATRIFVIASIVFGALGLIQVLTLSEDSSDASGFHRIVMRLLIASIFVILSSFAVSVAGKYLTDNRE